MTTLTRNIFLGMCLFILSCNENSGENKTDTSHKHNDLDSLGQPILGERINGPANIRDSVNGDIIFSLYDKTLVTCTEQNNGWFAIGLQMDIPNNEYNIDTLRKGRKIIVAGKEVGVILKDMYVGTATNTKQTWAELTGYTYKDNIYPNTVIENALTEYLAKNTSGTLKSLQPFIRSFTMDSTEQIKSFKTYFSYENWIDDPSPLLRIELIFNSDTLIGIAHSRNLSLPNTTDYSAERGFRVAFFNTTKKELRDQFIEKFNEFLRSVD